MLAHLSILLNLVTGILGPVAALLIYFVTLGLSMYARPWGNRMLRDGLYEIAKVRAYAQLWTELCESEYGVRGVKFRSGCQVRSLDGCMRKKESSGKITTEQER